MFNSINVSLFKTKGKKKINTRNKWHFYMVIYCRKKTSQIFLSKFKKFTAVYFLHTHKVQQNKMSYIYMMMKHNKRYKYLYKLHKR